MDVRRLIVSTALAGTLLAGVVNTTAAQPAEGAAANCVGEHVSMMAQMVGGMLAATEEHNDMHGTDLTVGEHLAHIRSEMCGR